MMPKLGDIASAAYSLHKQELDRIQFEEKYTNSTKPCPDCEGYGYKERMGAGFDKLRMCVTCKGEGEIKGAKIHVLQ